MSRGAWLAVCSTVLLLASLLSGAAQAEMEGFASGKQINAAGGYSFQSATLGKVILTRVTAAEGRSDDCHVSLQGLVDVVEAHAKAKTLQSSPLPGGKGITVTVDLKLQFVKGPKDDGELVPICSRAGTGCEVDLELPDDYLLQRM